MAVEEEISDGHMDLAETVTSSKVSEGHINLARAVGGAKGLKTRPDSQR